MKPDSPTPRTDAAVYADMEAAPIQEWVKADFARQLERELAEARKKQCHHGWRGDVPDADGRQIQTPCPACGARSLFIGAGGHLTCARVPSDHSDGCWSPSVEETIKNLKASSPTSDLEALMADGEIQDAAIRIICVGLPVGESVCVAPNCECYEKHGKQIIAALWKLLTEAIAKAKEGKS